MGALGARAGVRTTARRRGASLAGRRKTFLAHLAANCNVKAAAAAADVNVTTLYQWRTSEPAFADEWAQAVAAGYEMLEARLLEYALAGHSCDGTEMLEGLTGTPVTPVNITLALKLMELRQRKPSRRRDGPPLKVPAPGETLKVLLTRLDLIEQRKRAVAQRQAELAAPAVIESETER